MEWVSVQSQRRIFRSSVSCETLLPVSVSGSWLHTLGHTTLSINPSISIIVVLSATWLNRPRETSHTSRSQFIFTRCHSIKGNKLLNALLSKLLFFPHKDSIWFLLEYGNDVRLSRHCFRYWERNSRIFTTEYGWEVYNWILLLLPLKWTKFVNETF